MRPPAMATDATPSKADGDRPTSDQKVLRIPSGQLVQLEDTGGSEHIVISEESHDNRIVLDSNGILLEAGNNSIKLTGSSVTITSGRHKLEMSASAVTLDYNGMGAQALVLAPLLDWLQTHQHIGNMGAPTPPFPGDLITLIAPTPPKKSGP